MRRVPQNIDLELLQDTDNTFQFEVLDYDGDVVNLTGCTVKLSVKDAPNGTAKIATKTNTSLQHDTPTSGLTSFTIAKEDIDTEVTQDDITCWVYELRVIDGSSNENVYTQGLFKVYPSVGI